MKLQKVEKLDKKVISSIKICTRPFTSVILFDSIRNLTSKGLSGAKRLEVLRKE